MKENFLEDIQSSKFGENKCFLTIIRGFLGKYINENSRVNVLDSEIIVQAGDKLGSRDIVFSLSDDNLLVVIDRMIDLRRYHDEIIYDSEGIMMKRTSVNALVRDNANEFANSNPSILASEFKNMGENSSIYTGMIFSKIDVKKIERPQNYGLTGNYLHRTLYYKENGAQDESILEGEFNVLDSPSLSNLEFPSEDNIKVTKQEDLKDESIYTYPNSRSL